MSEKACVFSLAGVSHSFERWGSRVDALKGLNLFIESGEWVNLVGPNGSGKSTLLNILAGNVVPSSGTVLLHGQDISRMARSVVREKVFIIHQDPSRGTSPSLTVGEHLIVADQDEGCQASLRSMRKKHVEDLKSFEIDVDLDQPVYTLSGGQRQLLAILIARLRLAPVLLLDEPFAALDPAKALACTKAVEMLNVMGRTIVMVTHDAEFALSRGTRTVGLGNGMVVYDECGINRREENLAMVWASRGIGAAKQLWVV